MLFLKRAKTTRAMLPRGFIDIRSKKVNMRGGFENPYDLRYGNAGFGENFGNANAFAEAYIGAIFTFFESEIPRDILIVADAIELERAERGRISEERSQSFTPSALSNRIYSKDLVMMISN